MCVLEDKTTLIKKYSSVVFVSLSKTGRSKLDIKMQFLSYHLTWKENSLWLRIDFVIYIVEWQTHDIYFVFYIVYMFFDLWGQLFSSYLREIQDLVRETNICKTDFKFDYKGCWNVKYLC